MSFTKSKFNHKLRHEVEKYNYIARPKPSGYRGVHEIYTYNVTSENGSKYNGLYIELQFPTIYQHAWATAVEVVGRVTENQPKFNQGDESHMDFFRLASEIIARSKENCTGLLADLSGLELVEKFIALDDTINLLRLLGGISVIRTTSNIKNNVVLRLAKSGGLTIHPFIDLEKATEGYFELEKTYPDDDIVLVRAKTFHDIQSAYRNYFQNTEDFVKYIADGIKFLSKG